MSAHVMIDLETMGQGPNASITQIGAVEFDPDTGALGSEFSADVSLASSVRAGLEMDAGAVLWWIGQDEAARKSLLVGQDGARSLADALKAFRGWFQPLKPEGFWSHGATFDLPILSQACRALDVHQGWSFRLARDTRTLFWLCGEFNPWDEAPPPNETRHRAVDDARRQARAVARAVGFLRNEPRAAPLETPK